MTKNYMGTGNIPSSLLILTFLSLAQSHIKNVLTKNMIHVSFLQKDLQTIVVFLEKMPVISALEANTCSIIHTHWFNEQNSYLKQGVFTLRYGICLFCCI